MPKKVSRETPPTTNTAVFVDPVTGEVTDVVVDAKPYRDPPTGGVVTWERYLELLGVWGLRPDGSEALDPTPVAPPIGFVDTPDLWQQIRNMVASEVLRREAESQGFESFEESEDFEDDDAEGEFAPSGYEDEFEAPGAAAERQAVEAAAAAAAAPPGPAPGAPPASPPQPSGDPVPPVPPAPNRP